jgi:MFS transporter, AAHS family, cis,cis-muconate transporter
MDKTGKKVALAIAFALIVDGMNFQVLALTLPGIMKELKISDLLAGALCTYLLIGMGLGGLGAGWLADRIGRVRITWWAIVVFSLATIVVGFCRNYAQIAFMLFVSGIGISAVYASGSILVAEYVPTRIRNTVLGTLQACWSIGYVIAALLSSWILPSWGWRPLFVIAFLPGIPCLALLRGISDPPGWIAARKAYRSEGRKENEYVRMWLDPVTRRNFIFWGMTSVCLQFAYFGVNTWLPSYLSRDLGFDAKTTGWFLAGTYACMILGKAGTGCLGDIMGRRFMWVLAGLTTAVALPVIMYFANRENVGVLLLIFGLLYGAPYALNATYMSESFPTSIRATAVSASYNVGRIGSTFSPLLIGLIAGSYSVGFGIALLGIVYAICALIPGFFIPQKMFDPGEVIAAETNGDA